LQRKEKEREAMLDRMAKAKEQWERRQAAQEAEMSTLKASLEELNRRGQDRSSEIEKLTAANLAVASKEAELESTLKVLREEHRVWQEKDIILSKELNAVKAQAEDSMRRAKQVCLLMEQAHHQLNAPPSFVPLLFRPSLLCISDAF
jgi:hypothetical protein